MLCKNQALLHVLQYSREFICSVLRRLACGRCWLLPAGLNLTGQHFIRLSTDTYCHVVLLISTCLMSQDKCMVKMCLLIPNADKKRLFSFYNTSRFYYSLGYRVFFFYFVVLFFYKFFLLNILPYIIRVAIRKHALSILGLNNLLNQSNKEIS